MERRPPKNQFGYALLVFVLAIMGAGGLLLVGFSEGMLDVAESKKFEHNEHVLKEAKQALLQYAYNYPVLINPSVGPGRLPCADTNNNGTENCGSTFGRLPWNQANLNLYDIRDADGQRLWYGVSSNFRPQATTVNSDSSGTITLRDQSGNVIIDGSNNLSQYGIAAVIIAPGAVIDRNGVSQDRSIANSDDPFDTTADTDPGIITAANAGFINSDATDGFILGPVPDLTNDQFIVITAAEVIEMAEKAAMQAYRTAINDYRVNTSYCDGELPDGAATEAACLAAATPGTWTLGPYPWLYNYEGVTDIADMSSYYPANSSWATELATNLTTIGRIPTIFGDYFTEADSDSIDSELYGSVDITYPAGLDWDNGGKGSGTFAFNDGFTPPFYLTEVPDDVQFVDIGGNNGRLTTTFTGAEPPITLDLYFWDDDDDPFDVWTSCPDDGDGVPEISDCHRAECTIPAVQCSVPTPGTATTDYKLYIMHIEATLGWAATPGVVNFDLDYSTPPVIEITPATSTSHAIISATFPAASVINGTMPALTGTANFDFCPHYHVGDDPSDFAGCVEDSGTVTLADFSVNELTLGVRYYPELPDWAFDNGWHNSMILHYAKGYEPGGTQTCDPLVFDPNTSCIFIRMRDFSATEPWNRDQIAVLLNTGEHGWVDDNTDGDFEDNVDRDSVVDSGNREFDYILRWRDPGDPDSGNSWEVPPGNDNLLILEELP